jgi:predicted kinase
MVTRAAAALASNLLVILDATFLSEHHRLLIEGLAEITGARITRVWCHCSTKTALTRIGERVGDPSDATAGVRFQQEQGGGPCPENWLRVSTEGTIVEIEAELRQRGVLPLMVAD